MRRNQLLFFVATAMMAATISVSTWLIARRPPIDNKAEHTPSSLEKTKISKTLRVGYSGFSPYTIIDLKTTDPKKRISGLCVDMVNEIASRQEPPWQVEWSKVTFETLKPDMESGKFDVFADAVYETVPRAANFGFSIPYSYFGVAAAVVRKDETRFQTYGDLDKEDVSIVLAEGWTATEYARRTLKKSHLRLIAVGDDPFVQFQDVLLGRADVALQDVPTVLQFTRAHPAEVKALWVDNPPTRVPAGFMTRQGDWEMLHFLDVSIRALEAEGTLERLDCKWLSLSDYPETKFRQGAGLR